MLPGGLGRRIPGWVWGAIVGVLAGFALAHVTGPDVRQLERGIQVAQSEAKVARVSLARTREVADSLSELLTRAEKRSLQVTAPLRGRGPLGVRPIVRRTAERVDTLQPAMPVPADTTPLELEEAARALPIVVAALDSMTFAAQAREAAAMAERAAATYMIAQQDTIIARQAAAIRAYRRSWWKRAGSAVLWVAAGAAGGFLAAR